MKQTEIEILTDKRFKLSSDGTISKKFTLTPDEMNKILKRRGELVKEEKKEEKKEKKVEKKPEPKRWSRKVEAS